MTLIQIINTILVLILGPLVVFCCAALYMAIQRMPTAQRAALEQFSRMAVRHVAQQDIQSNQTELAKAYTVDLFKAFRLPVPSAEVLDVAVGSAMHEIKNNG
jgi:phosphate/sulfate permease